MKNREAHLRRCREVKGAFCVQGRVHDGLGQDSEVSPFRPFTTW